MAKKSQASLTKAFEEMVKVNCTPKPHRSRATHYYSKHYYNDRVKPWFDHAMKQAKVEAECNNEPPPPIIKVRNRVTLERWNQETPEFKRMIAQRIEEEYEEATKKWEAEQTVKEEPTPEEVSL